MEGDIKGDPQRIRALNKKEKSFLILTKDSLNLYENGALIKEVKLPVDSQALDVNEILDEIYVGDNVIFNNYLIYFFLIIFNKNFFIFSI